MSSNLVRKGLIALAAMVALALIAFGPQVVAQLSKPTTGPALSTAAVRSFAVTATASGTLLPQSLLTVNFPVSGQVAEVAVQPGAQVRSGQILAKLNDATQQAALNAAQAVLSAATAALHAAQSPSRPDPNAVASAQAQVANAGAQVQRAQAAEAQTVLKAPGDGTVLQVNSQVGSTVNAGITGVPAIAGSSGTIMDPTALTSTKTFIVIGSGTTFQIVAAFSQNDATQLTTGQTGTVSFDALPGLPFPCHVSAVASGASIVGGVPQFYAALAADQTDPRLRAGMTASVSIGVAQATNVLAVPSQALYLLDNLTFVDVWYQGHAVPTHVVSGLSGTQLTQIVSGLSPGQQVVLSAQQPLPGRAAASPATTASP
jgi:membrane fusion protein, macrolide-specific efflux system